MHTVGGARFVKCTDVTTVSSTKVLRGLECWNDPEAKFPEYDSISGTSTWNTVGLRGHTR